LNTVGDTGRVNMPHGIETVTVIGAGTMGAAIAGHLANAGLSVHLLDMIPTTLTTDERAAGLSLHDAKVRNRIVQAGYMRMTKARPSNLFGADVASRIHIGNLEDDLEAAVEASDWIIEAIIEQLAPKQALMARLEQLAPAHAIISTNTSGIPIAQISAERTLAFQQHFLGAHFFNPPRYLHLLELIPTPTTDPAITQRLRAFAEEVLGKGVVICHDTPNFIANRMVSYLLAELIAFAVENGYTVEEVDALTGPLLGRPRSGTFRLNDVVGIDVWVMIAHNLHALIPNDADRDALLAPAYLTVMQSLIDQGHLGVKSGQGFYQTVTDDSGNKSFWALDLAAARRGEIVYQPPQNPTWPEVEPTQRLPLAERLRALVASEGRASALIWHTLSKTFAYAAARIPEIADTIVDIDRALEWGYGWELGPFALWDTLGIEGAAARMKEEGIVVAPWVETMLSQGYSSFYRQVDGKELVYHPQTGSYGPLEQDPRVQTVTKLRTHSATLAENDAATLLDIGDGVLLLEFHCKLNVLDLNLFPIVDVALERLHGNATALVFANDGLHFSAGANLRAMLAQAEAGDWEAIETLICKGQADLLALRAASKPVIAAPFGRALGGGAEICLASHQVVAHAETNIGLVEFKVGLIPGWGGCKEMVRRHVDPQAPLDGLRHIMALITQAQVSGSAHEAKTLGLLAVEDRVVMHRGHLIHVARQSALELAPGFCPPATTGNVYAAGERAFATLQAEIATQAEAGKLLPHDQVIATALARVLCGDGGAVGWRDEQAFLDLERQTFIELMQTKATQARIRHLLTTGKPLRN
jgi:3-hydroxyacyl-CoA dehydrogenase